MKDLHDFSNAQVGDVVSHPYYGEGVITEIKPYDIINVDFGKLAVWFTIEGKENPNAKASLYNGRFTFNIEAIPIEEKYFCPFCSKEVARGETPFGRLFFHCNCGFTTPTRKTKQEAINDLKIKL